MSVRDDSTMACRDDIPFAVHMPVHAHRRLPLWEERFSREILETRLADMGERDYARSHQQRAISPEELIFAKWVDRCLDNEHVAVERVEKGEYWDQFPRVAGVDVAIANNKEESAFFALLVMAVTPDQHRWPLYLFREKIGFTQQVELLQDVHERFRLSVMMVENNAYQDSIIQLTAETSLVPVQGTYTGKIQMHDLELGMPSMATEYEHKKWHIPQGDARSLRMFEPFLHELRMYPAIKLRDTVMASFFARQGVVTGKRRVPTIGVIRY